MSPRPCIIALAALAATLIAGACTGSDATGPSGPNVAGLWTGVFGSSSASLVLNQSGPNLSGTLTVGLEVVAVSGEVDGAGVATWGSEAHRVTCAAYASTSGLQLRAAGDSLVGAAQRRQGQRVCDPSAGGVVAVQQATMRLSRVSP